MTLSSLYFLWNRSYGPGKIPWVILHALVFRKLNSNCPVGQDIELGGKLCGVAAIWVTLPTS